MLKSLFKIFSSFLERKHFYLIKSLCYTDQQKFLPANLDYVRYTSLALCCQEISVKKLQGNLAEVGVYKGNFAKQINALFPDKKLYLFDTFEGFSESDISVEKQEGYSAANQDFSATSINLVKSKMKYPQNCIFKKGFFPDTAKDVDDTFCFVSLDADLFSPIYEGLKFFYPKLVSGGYIFVHDFNNVHYRGARESVIKFCREEKIGFVPIPDVCGTAIITK